jgi:LysM repeat protein
MMPPIRISTETLAGLERVCQDFSDHLQSNQKRTQLVLEDALHTAPDQNFGEFIQQLSSHKLRLQTLSTILLENLRRVREAIEELESQNRVDCSKLGNRIEGLQKALKEVAGGIGTLPATLVAPNSKVQREAQIATLSPAGGEPIAVSRLHPSQPGGAAQFSRYTVVSGDCLSSIAQRHGVSLGSVIASNPQIHDPNLILPGQTIHLEGFHPTVPIQTAGLLGHHSTIVVPQAQHVSDSCGQTSVAMCVTSLTGKTMTDSDINNRYGYGLMDALNTECRPAGYQWKDAGDLKTDSWSQIDEKVNREGLPVIVALNGPEFSASGRGHIVTIVKVEGDCVYYADPATGEIRSTSKASMNNAPSHPDGNFVFIPDRLA